MAVELNLTYFRDPDGHLMEILTPVSGEPA
jgi:catechol 2,3-dioxygenase-like lactoylglutathione lyase family enzyme